MKTKIYSVQKIDNNQLIINGRGNNISWNNANTISNFCSPWNKDSIKSIEFKALYDSINLYFLFKVFDNNIHINNATDTYKSINNSDRVELFFTVDNSLTPYYCLEIDPNARLMDFKGLPNRNFDFNWNWPKDEIDIKSNITKEYFTVEGAISIKSLNNLHLLKNNVLKVGIYRAKYKLQPNLIYEPTWIPWVNPNTSEPDFHIYSSFGEFILEK